MAGQGENQFAQAKLTPVADKTPVQVAAKAPVFWRHDKQWNADWIKKYQAYMTRFIDQLLDASANDQDEKFTCEDLPFTALIRFASVNKLPLKLKIGNDVYQNQPKDQRNLYSDFGYSPKGYENMVNSKSGAKDVYENSSDVTFNSLLAGDVITQFSDGAEHVNNKNNPFHAQLVYKRTENLVLIAQGQASFGTIKNAYGIGWFDETNPSKSGYIGNRVEFARYTKTQTGWTYTHDDKPNTKRPELINQISTKRWKFNYFNY